MTRVQLREDGNQVIIIETEPDDKCELCGKIDELRPYGPNGERICFDCGMKDEKTTAKRFGHILFGDEHDPVFLLYHG
uniref:Uncharacterized protein n=1 Tax=viral metagenome TaxID=1070528 RepID=A0A6H1ZYA0_9ZZZZ